MYVIQNNDIYVECVGTGNVGTELTESEHNTIVQKIRNKPTAPNGYTYKLRADNLKWELVELPEPIDEEADPEDYESALAEMGVDFSDQIQAGQKCRQGQTGNQGSSANCL